MAFLDISLPFLWRWINNCVADCVADRYLVVVFGLRKTPRWKHISHFGLVLTNFGDDFQTIRIYSYIGSLLDNWLWFARSCRIHTKSPAQSVPNDVQICLLLLSKEYHNERRSGGPTAAPSASPTGTSWLCSGFARYFATNNCELRRGFPENQGLK